MDTSPLPMKGCKIRPMTFEQGGGSKSSLPCHTCFNIGPRSHPHWHPYVCRKRRRNGAFLRMRQEKPSGTIKISLYPKALRAEHRLYLAPPPEIGIWEFTGFFFLITPFFFFCFFVFCFSSCWEKKFLTGSDPPLSKFLDPRLLIKENIHVGWCQVV